MPLAVREEASGRVRGGGLDSQPLELIERKPASGVANLPRKLPDHLLQLHRETSILVLDDRPEAAERTAEALRQYYRRENRCDVIVMTDPKAALDALVSGRVRPDAVVTDLFMPGLHGDEFVKRLGEAGILLPVVVNSGSWANPIKEHMFDRLAESEDRGAAEAMASENCMGRSIPITRLGKYGDGDYPLKLAMAVDSVLTISRVADRRGDKLAWADFLREYAESKFESTPSRAYTAYLGETAGLLAEEIPAFIREVDAKWPKYWETDKTLNPLKKPHLATEALKCRTGIYSNESFSDPEGGDVPRHDFGNFLMALGRKDRAGKWAGGIGEEGRGEFIRFMSGWLGRWGGYVNGVYSLRQRMGEREVIDLAPRVELIPKVASAGMRTIEDVDYELTRSPGEFKYRGLPQATEETIKELVRNALKATYDVGKPRVTVRLARAEYGGLPQGVREFMDSKHGDSKGAGYAALSVEDNGCGMSTAEIERALGGGFSKFKETVGGSGSGLGFLRRLWGEEGIGHTVESTPGEGTRFTVFFKLEA
jgi:CheY-like chemotaxis protein